MFVVHRFQQQNGMRSLNASVVRAVNLNESIFRSIGCVCGTDYWYW